MLEIAGGIVIAAIVLWIVLAFLGEIVSVVGGVILCFGALYLLLGILALLCCVVVWAYAKLGRLIGHEAAHAIAEPVVGCLAILLPFGLWLDSLDDFPVCGAGWRLIRNSCRQSAWKTRWKRYRIVSGHRQQLFVLAHAPYLWLAQLRKRPFPWSRVQRRVH